jgi:hypothetical protein
MAGDLRSFLFALAERCDRELASELAKPIQNSGRVAQLRQYLAETESELSVRRERRAHI